MKIETVKFLNRTFNNTYTMIVNNTKSIERQKAIEEAANMSIVLGLEVQGLIDPDKRVNYIEIAKEWREQTVIRQVRSQLSPAGHKLICNVEGA